MVPIIYSPIPSYVDLKGSRVPKALSTDKKAFSLYALEGRVSTIESMLHGLRRVQGLGLGLGFFWVRQYGGLFGESRI